MLALIRMLHPESVPNILTAEDVLGYLVLGAGYWVFGIECWVLCNSWVSSKGPVGLETRWCGALGTVLKYVPVSAASGFFDVVFFPCSSLLILFLSGGSWTRTLLWLLVCVCTTSMTHRFF